MIAFGSHGRQVENARCRCPAAPSMIRKSSSPPRHRIRLHRHPVGAESPARPATPSSPRGRAPGHPSPQCEGWKEGYIVHKLKVDAQAGWTCDEYKSLLDRPRGDCPGDVGQQRNRHDFPGGGNGRAGAAKAPCFTLTPCSGQDPIDLKTPRSICCRCSGHTNCTRPRALAFYLRRGCRFRPFRSARRPTKSAWPSPAPRSCPSSPWAWPASWPCSIADAENTTVKLRDKLEKGILSQGQPLLLSLATSNRPPNTLPILCLSYRKARPSCCC